LRNINRREFTGGTPAGSAAPHDRQLILTVIARGSGEGL
jgi:hypothetical protein